ncbi:hypothetical protein AB0F18_16625 [Streptomyces sp. NPDC029216]|uniref:hypothetical protein n=1 Tax=Streptomyces sp. NPDC029216 TaxID=3154701 RepID=UPI0033E780AA
MTPSARPGTCRVWYCGRCRAAYKSAPPLVDTACSCETSVWTLHPTTVTVPHTPPAPRPQALNDDEARHRALARPGRRVQVTFEADVDTAWLTRGADGHQHLTVLVITDDGQHHAIDTRLPGVRIDAAQPKEKDET